MNKIKRHLFFLSSGSVFTLFGQQASLAPTKERLGASQGDAPC